MKKYIPFKWDKQQGCSFTKIKSAIDDAPFLQSTNFNKDFILYTFSSGTDFAAVLMQQNEDKSDTPITFMSSWLQGAELK